MLLRPKRIAKSRIADGIFLDDEEPRGARLTLERATRSAPFAVTYGVYGWMGYMRFKPPHDMGCAFREHWWRLLERARVLARTDAPLVGSGIIRHRYARYV